MATASRGRTAHAEAEAKEDTDAGLPQHADHPPPAVTRSRAAPVAFSAAVARRVRVRFRLRVRMPVRRPLPVRRLLRLT
ncbi:hypothetical protein K7472_09030 [Streptomyces sp. PTM05]|uniref:Uncharacterized protein n=1 Tax=Streptantibioticus parmotrematis TaxID=2873249 RepID=A0ABS7QQG9_9ACTN|nr:hypothetical protein [Streptantibioticus parmotrematis]MBY8884986.1 hypothetical protein [Streptantibioticus parmotrematis]